MAFVFLPVTKAKAFRTVFDGSVAWVLTNAKFPAPLQMGTAVQSDKLRAVTIICESEKALAFASLSHVRTFQ